jgi:hypothetical protein
MWGCVQDKWLDDIDNTAGFFPTLPFQDTVLNCSAEKKRI